MSEHAWVQENLDAFVSGGLAVQECERLERHLQSCNECATLKAEIGEVERLIVGVCARARPDAGLEGRAIERLRRLPKPRPHWLRFVTAAAAVVLLGLIGGAVRYLALDGTLPMIGGEERVLMKKVFADDKSSNPPRTDVLEAESARLSVGLEGFTGGTLFANEKHIDPMTRIDVGKSDGLISANDAIEKGMSESRGEGRDNLPVISVNSVVVEPKRDDMAKLLPELRSDGKEVQAALDRISWSDRENWSARKLKPAPYTNLPTPPPAFPPDDKVADKLTDDPKSDKGSGARITPAELPAQPKTEPKEPAPEKSGRMIIRTGDMEFETDSFDKARDAIAMLITTVKGGFIATINRDTLPNGKTKGAVVVRMPPASLDKFILDLRRDLAKSSELKSERLGSLDISKQFTDIESRLRAARAIEDRLINIIKTGKGEIKDLVAAEKELGVWRTKIEEMEGEIRYYANQVALSTLTISLTEKEIQAPTAIVVTDTVSVRIEADDVGKAHQIAMKAVEDFKGRITRSELKQQEAGQFFSVLFAEIPPDKKDKFFDKLKTLGIVSDHQENQRQHMEGGTGKAPELKPRQADVLFQVTINNIANVQPRISVDLKIAAADVPGAYGKLVEAIAKAKGQIRGGSLNEHDKNNTDANLYFDVPAAEKPGIDKLLAEIGEVLERAKNQAPIDKISTPSKFGYTVSLKDIASIRARETFDMQLAAVDVPESYRELKAAITAAKGQLFVSQLTEDNRVKLQATLHFDVPAAERPAIEKALAKASAVMSRSSAQIAANAFATDQKVGYKLVIRNIGSIPPRETVRMKLEVKDVDARAAELKELVAAAKGRVIDSNIDRYENGQVIGVILFEVPFAAEDSVLRQMKSAGTVISQKAARDPKVAENDLTTAHILVTLVGVAPIVPSDEGLGSYVRTSLHMSFKVFSVCVMLIILGVSAVLPWALVIWIAYRIYMRIAGPRLPAFAAAPTPAPPSS